jgi:hypothetical protein
MHYRRGVSTIHDMISQKLLRAQSLLEPLENGDMSEPNFESLEDTYKDLINYASFAVSYIRGKMEGQVPTRDMFNRNRVNGGLAESEVFTKPSPHSETDVIPRYTDGDAAAMVAVKETYKKEVASVGPIKYPEEVDDTITDSISRTYESVKDVGDRIDDDEADHRNSIRRRGT